MNNEECYDLRYSNKHEKIVRYSLDGWERCREEIRTTLTSGQPIQAVQLWLDYFVYALLDWELETCRKLINEHFPFPGEALFIIYLLKSGVDAIIEGNYSSAQAMLDFLVNPKTSLPEFSTPATSIQANLRVLQGRIELQSGKSETALAHFEAAIELAPELGLPHAGLGQYYLILKDYSNASVSFQECARLSPILPDGYTGMGMLLLEQKIWDEAREWHSQAAAQAAIQYNPFNALQKLLAPVSGNLFLSLGRTLETTDPATALLAVNQALTLGIQGASQYADVVGYELRGRLHEKLGHQFEAANDLYEAGRRFGWRGELEKSIRFLKDALVFNDQDERIYWNLADNCHQSVDKVSNLDRKNELLNDALKYWEMGEAINPPGREYTWAFLTRSLINNTWCDVNKPSLDVRTDKYWEGHYYIERGWLSQENDIQNWIYLARNYRNLDLLDNCFWALKQAVDKDKNDANVQEELLIYLTNSGYSGEALELIEQVRSKLESAWLAGVEAFNNFTDAQFDQVVRLSEIDLDQEWLHQIRALALLYLGRKEDAIQEYEDMLKYYHPEDITTYSGYAMCKFQLAMLSGKEAIDIRAELELVRQAAQDERTREDTLPTLALMLTANEDTIDDARQVYIETLSLAKNRRKLIDLKLRGLNLVELYAPQWQHGQKALEIVTEIKSEVDAQLENWQERIQDPESELLVARDRLIKHGKSGGTVWLAVQAGLARFYLVENRLEQAAETYLSIHNSASDVPELHFGLEMLLAELTQQIDNRFKERKFALAEESLTICIDVAGALEQGNLLPKQRSYARAISGMDEQANILPEQRSYARAMSGKDEQANILPKLFVQQAYASVMSGKDEQAAKHIETAFEQLVNNTDVQPGEQVGNILLKLVGNVDDFWVVYQFLKRYQDDNLGTGRIEYIQSAQQILVSYLDAQYQLKDQGQGQLELIPIALEIPAHLLPQGSSANWSMLASDAPSIRTHLKKYGVDIPGVHIREADSSLYPVPWRVLIDGRSIYEENLDAFETDTRFNEFSPMDAVHTAVKHNLARFFDLYQFEKLLKQWAKEDRIAILINTLLVEPDQRFRFWRALRLLVREQVPISSLGEELLNTWKEEKLDQADALTAMCALRLRIKASLPGNIDPEKWVNLPSEVETRMNSYRIDHQSPPVIPWGEADALVQEIGKLGVQDGTDWVLVCQDGSLRPYVRYLIESSYPDVMVLSQDELTEVLPEPGVEQE